MTTTIDSYIARVYTAYPRPEIILEKMKGEVVDCQYEETIHALSDVFKVESWPFAQYS